MTSNGGATPAEAAGQCGMTLVELLVGLALSSLGVAVLAQLAGGVLATFEADPAAAEQQQRGRATMAVLVEDVTRAGAAFVDEAAGAPLRGVPMGMPDGWRYGAWTVTPQPSTLAVVAGARTAAHARLSGAVVAGESRLILDRPGYCSPASPTCRFAAGDDVLLMAADGAVVLAAVRAVAPPLVVDLAAPLAQGWPAGTRVSVVDARTYALRADPSTGLQQIVRSAGPGPAMPLVDFVQRFDIEWLVDGAAPVVYAAPDATEEGASRGPLPPPAGTVGDPAWPAGENCVFARPGGGVAMSRLQAIGAGAVAVPLSRFADGPWCPSAAASTRWDADLVRVVAVRVRLEVAVASALLRPPLGTLLGAGSAKRMVPTLALAATIGLGNAAEAR
jgi:prepilin-type N-terminal cleavage/methylation domain-containing protein